VLPLMGHAYLHYLYAPSAGLAIAIVGAMAWALEAMVPRRAAAAAAWMLAAGILVAHAATADRLLVARQSAKMQGLDLPADPYFRKCAVARNAIADLSQTLAGASHVRMLVFDPPGSGFTYDAITGELLDGPRAGTRQYSLLEAVLDEGRALRAVFPQVDTVVFVRRWTPEYDSFSLYTFNLEGHVAYLGDGPAGLLRLAQMMVEFERWDAAREHLSAVVTRYPDDADLRYLNARVLEHANDRPGAIRELLELLRRTPGAPQAAEAESLLVRLRAGSP
jgi:hypothetical protein